MQNDNGAVDLNNQEDVVVVDSFDADALKKLATTAMSQKKHFREKFEKSEAEKAELSKQLEAIKAQQLPKADAPKEEKIDLNESLFENISAIRSLADDELSELRGTAKELGVDPVKYIKSKAGLAQLKDFRAQRKTQETTATPSSKIPTFNGKPISQILTDPKASPEEKQKAFEARMKKGANSSL
jgi:transketolase